MVEGIVVATTEQAVELLKDPSFKSQLFAEPFDPESGQADIIPLEQSLAERFNCDRTAEGFAHLSFALDSTWKIIDGLYQKQQTARPQVVYAGFDTLSDDEVTATYVVPFAAIGQGSKAVELSCNYAVKNVTVRGKTYRKLGRQTLSKGVELNPFYTTAEKTDEIQSRVTDQKIMSSYRRRGSFGTR